MWGDQAYRGQRAVIRHKAPRARDFTNRRYHHRGLVNAIERATNRTKSKMRAKVEGSVEDRSSPRPPVVNDYISSWIGMVGAIAALRRRATEGGSYRVRVSLARVSLWLQMGIFDKSYASVVAARADDHAYPDPDLFEAETPWAIIKASPTRSLCQAHRVSLPYPWSLAAPAGRSGWPADFARVRLPSPDCRSRATMACYRTRRPVPNAPSCRRHSDRDRARLVQVGGIPAVPGLPACDT